MAVTVLGRWHARAGHEQAFLEAATAGLERHLDPERVHHARVLRSDDSPSQFLILAEWASREAFWEMMRTRTQTGVPLLAHAADVPAHQYFERLGPSAAPTAPAQHLRCAVLTVPAEHHAVVEAFLLDGPVWDADTVSRAVYRAVDHPTQFLVVHGWRASSRAARRRADPPPERVARLRAWGAHWEWFDGTPLYELGTPAGPPGSDLRAVAQVLDALLAGAELTPQSRGAVLRLAAECATLAPADWERAFRAAWGQATAALASDGGMAALTAAPDPTPLEARLLARLRGALDEAP